MAESTGIGWCDATFNPWIGCEKVSPGCAHCYAETLVHGRMGRGGTWGPDGVRERTSPSNWKKPLRWAKLARWGNLPNGTENPDGHRPRVFCASLADVFEERPELDPWRDELFELIAATPELDWLVLTKRPELAREFLFELDTASGLGGRWVSRDDPEPFGWGCPFNLWVGTSIENARHTYRADVLREIPAAVRFISAEPLLGSLFESKSRRQLVRDREASSEVVRMFIDEGAEPDDASRYVREVEASLVHRDKHPLDLHGIDWVIVGGESGPGARPMRVEWAREIRDACRYCGPAIFVKQLGKEPTERRHWRTIHDLPAYIDEPLELRHKKGEDWAEWPADLRIREFPASATVPA